MTIKFEHIVTPFFITRILNHYAVANPDCSLTIFIVSEKTAERTRNISEVKTKETESLPPLFITVSGFYQNSLRSDGSIGAAIISDT